VDILSTDQTTSIKEERKTMFTRQDYLNGKCNHREYYAQFVNESIKSMVKNNFGIERLRNSFTKDEYFNNIPLQSWDNLTYSVNCRKELESLGDFPTLAGKVCILKEAARQLIES
jgi:hypothetical protein